MNTWKPEDIKMFREKWMLSQKALSELVGVTDNYIYLLEKGVKNPSKTLKLLFNCVSENLQKKKENEK
ncbi:MAG: helix-turn-helix transcriptional regulator [Nitrospirae bacterium]|nr:helix-turn-helix transcriptional regulator [Nitrospirota bacterium]